MIVGVLPAVGSQEVNPLGFEPSTTNSDIIVDLVGLFRDMEGLVGWELELGLQRYDIIGLESWKQGQSPFVQGVNRGGLTRSVDTMRALKLRTVPNGCPQSDDRWLMLLLASLGDCLVDASVIAMDLKPLASGSTVANTERTGHHRPHEAPASRRPRTEPRHPR